MAAGDRFGEQEVGVGARRPGSGPGADHRRGGQPLDQQRGLELLVEEVGDAHRRDAQQLESVAPAVTPELAAAPGDLPEVAGGRRRERRRRLAHHALEQRAEPGEEAAVADVGLGVVARKGGDLADLGHGAGAGGPLAAVAGDQDAGAAGFGEQHRRRVAEGEALALEAQLRRRARRHAALVVEDAGHPVAGVELDHARQPADRAAPLEHHDAASRAGQPRRGGQAVLPAAHDDDIDCRRGHRRYTARPWSIARAQRAPGAPMMPPPGWVPEAHIQRSSIGVR